MSIRFKKFQLNSNFQNANKRNLRKKLKAQMDRNIQKSIFPKNLNRRRELPANATRQAPQPSWPRPGDQQVQTWSCYSQSPPPWCGEEAQRAPLHYCHHNSASERNRHGRNSPLPQAFPLELSEWISRWKR